jgi:hypothetical protein
MGIDDPLHGLSICSHLVAHQRLTIDLFAVAGFRAWRAQPTGNRRCVRRVGGRRRHCVVGDFWIDVFLPLPHDTAMHNSSAANH